jgi:hypothetical protein
MICAATLLAVTRTAAMMVPWRPGGNGLDPGTGIMSGTPVHPRALHDLHGDEQGHDEDGDEGAERPRGTGHHGPIIQQTP